MKSRVSSKLLLGFLALSAYQALTCDFDNGLDFENASESIHHGIRGHITFSGTWPAEIGEARLVASANFPPDPLEPLDAFIFSDPIQVGVASLNYGVSLDPATYRIVAVIFRERNQPWDISNILAVHAPLNPCTIIPDLSQAVVVETDTSVVDGVDLVVDFTKGSLSGNVEFIGEWSPDIAFVGIIALVYPLDLLNLVPCGLAILPLGVEQANYRIRVPANNYSLLIVAGQNLSNITNIADLRILGTYFSPGDETRPGVVQVLSNKDTPNIDMVADLRLFSN